MLDLKTDKLKDSGKEEEGKTFHSLQVLGMNEDLRDMVRWLGSETVCVGRASGCSNTSHWIGDDRPDFQGAISVKVIDKSGKICNQRTMRERETEEIWWGWIVDETDGFGLDLIEKTERGIRSTIPDMGPVLTKALVKVKVRCFYRVKYHCKQGLVNQMKKLNLDKYHQRKSKY